MVSDAPQVCPQSTALTPTPSGMVTSVPACLDTGPSQMEDASPAQIRPTGTVPAASHSMGSISPSQLYDA